MTLADAMNLYQQKLVVVTLALLVQDGKLLLARKQKKIGAGLWNGPGGKVELDETIEEAMVRETQEEIGVTPLQYEKKGEIEFYLPHTPEWCMYCHVFLVTGWEGEVAPTGEMLDLTWFSYDQLPFAEMWPDDEYWLPLVLMGKYVNAAFLLGEKKEIIEQELKIA